MKSTKEISDTFIVRLWFEPREIKDARPIWRGVIEPVGEEDPVYFDHLDKMNVYFANYLERVIKNRYSEQ